MNSTTSSSSTVDPLPSSTAGPSIVGSVPLPTKGPDGECVDIKQFLWTTSGDLTSLPSTMSIFAVVYTLIITLGVVGNTLVVVSVRRHKSLQSVRNIFIVSLSCSDIVVSLLSGIITPTTAFTKIWLFGHALCRLVPLIQGSSLCFSTLTLTAISIDRFILIVFPTKRSIQKKHAFAIIALNCAAAIAISLPMFFKQALVDYAGFCGQFCSEDWGDDETGRSTYGTLVFIMQFVLPIFCITFCYMMISLKLGKGLLLKKDSDELRKLSSLHSEQRKQALRRRLRTNKMLMAMVGVFLCCWTPSVVFNFLRDYQWLGVVDVVARQEYLFGIITHCISMSSTVWNPILYALLNEQFRLAFAELLRTWHKSDDVLSLRRFHLSSRITHRCSRLFSNAFLDLSVSQVNGAVLSARHPLTATTNTESVASRNGSLQWKTSDASQHSPVDTTRDSSL